MNTSTSSFNVGMDTSNASATASGGLRIRNLQVTRPDPGGETTLVHSVSIDVAPGRCLGLVGESGAGKSVTCYAALGLLERSGLRVTGDVTLGDTLISNLSPREQAKFRGRDVAMIFQEPSVSLNPAFRIGAQIAEIVRWHQGGTRTAAWKRAVECLEMVGMPNPQRRAKEYPHTLSGGLRQRAMIAMAICCEPRVLIADEATTALDVTVQSQILTLLRNLQSELDMAMIVVTHDLGVAADVCDDVAVMYAGRIVETGSVERLYYDPAHPYTQGLLDSVPSITERTDQILGIPGMVPAPELKLRGCRFAPRCDYARPICRERESDLCPAGAAHLTRCIRHSELSLRGVGRKD